jgi:SAM-dependent methyltransferase
MSQNELNIEILKTLNSVKNSKILDIGSGDFRHKIENFSKFNNKYFPIDLKKSGHTMSNKKLAEIYDGVNIPYKSDFFDFVIFTEVLEHVEQPNKLKQDIHRVLKKKGKVLITVPYLFAEHEMPYDFRRFTLNGLIKFFNYNKEYTILKKKKIFKGISSIERLISSELTKTKKIENYLVDKIFRYSLKIIFYLIGLFYKFDNSYGGSLILLKKK